MNTETVAMQPLDLMPLRPVDFRWIDMPPEQRTYETPHEEYIRSFELLSREKLAKRWDGLVHEREIYALFARHNLRFEREMHQIKVLKDTGFSAADRDFQEGYNNLQVARAMSSIARMEAIIESGETTDSQIIEIMEEDKEEHTLRRRHHLATFVRPLRVREIAILEQRIDEKIKMIMRLTGQATEISQSSVDVTFSINDALRQALREQDPEYARLEAIEQGRPDVRVNRMIDVTEQSEIR